MAVRIRADGTILCAAMHPALHGDVYVDDSHHYRLSVEMKVLQTQRHEEHQHRGQWWWKGCAPPDVVIDPFYLECK